jgi:hypothetical protein
MEPCILIPEGLNELTVACTRITHLTLHYVVGDLSLRSLNLLQFYNNCDGTGGGEQGGTCGGTWSMALAGGAATGSRLLRWG